MKRQNLFLTKTFMALAFGFLTAIYAPVEGLVKGQGDPWKHVYNILLAAGALLGGSAGRLDAKGPAYTPRGLPGPNPEPDELELEIEERQDR